jgi:hypothetical protein
MAKKRQRQAHANWLRGDSLTESVRLGHSGFLVVVARYEGKNRGSTYQYAATERIVCRQCSL